MLSRLRGYLALVAAFAIVAFSLRQPAAAPLAATTGPSTVAFQGQVLVSGSPFSGSAAFKFAVVNAAGTQSFWSNDNTSSGGAEPAASVGLAVQAGVFSVSLGDTSVAGMSSALTPAVFAAADRRLRVWFATSAAGSFSQLSPDSPFGSAPFALNAETIDGIDGADFQKRISACLAGQAMTAVDANGTPSCATLGTLSTVIRTTALIGDGTLGNPLGVTSQAQNRVTGACIGSEIRSFNADGSVVCGARPVAVAAPTAHTITTINSAEAIDYERSIGIGVDGLPIIAYYNGSALRVLHCGTILCDSGNLATTVDSAGNVGRYNSITFDQNGNPVIAYHDVTNGDLKVVSCSNVTCSGVPTISTVDTGSPAANVVGQYTSIAISSSGFPIISYYDATSQKLKVASCTSLTCSGTSTITTAPGSNDLGRYSSIAIGIDNLPVISYYDNSFKYLLVRKCTTFNCVTFGPSTNVDTSGDAGQFSSIIIGSDGFPFIAYYDLNNTNLDTVHCAALDCNSAFNTFSTVDGALPVATSVGQHIGLALGLDGLPIISYYDATNTALKVAHCGNLTCNLGNTIVTANNSAPSGGNDNTGDGRYSSIAIGSDGLPIIVHHDGFNLDLKIVHLGSTTGVPYWRR